MNNKLVSLASFFLGIIIFVVAIGSALAPVHAKANTAPTNIDVPELVINSDTVQEIKSNSKAITIDEVKVTPNKKLSGKVRNSTPKIASTHKQTCFWHELEQQGAPTARFVKVCG
jgi:hypothetical protein